MSQQSIGWRPPPLNWGLTQLVKLHLLSDYQIDCSFTHRGQCGAFFLPTRARLATFHILQIILHSNPDNHRGGNTFLFILVRMLSHLNLFYWFLSFFLFFGDRIGKPDLPRCLHFFCSLSHSALSFLLCLCHWSPLQVPTPDYATLSSLYMASAQIVQCSEKEQKPKSYIYKPSLTYKMVKHMKEHL